MFVQLTYNSRCSRVLGKMKNLIVSNLIVNLMNLMYIHKVQSVSISSVFKDMQIKKRRKVSLIGDIKCYLLSETININKFIFKTSKITVYPFRII